ncbi:exopolysaccharide production repressor protein (plasmid) [Shinella sp. PSBB067]|uniref:exopolysaccharide production repressor protein n=1 Tax=unclassified Shinella TaxID=2643062 RepID=UPI00193B8BC7|nr:MULTISPECIES: exopolysaccharide production repressor protein [unclassified Shinella]QRI66540.1 exopolysaccharide production repressor protein [Shinella sp. PSBB067]
MKRAPETKWRDSTAYAPRFFLSMGIALVAFAAVTYVSTGSIATTALRTFLCAILIQVGYFLATLYLVWRTAKARRAGTGTARPDLEKAKPQVSVPMNEPGHSKP